MSEDPKRIVEEGYDAIAERYAKWAPTIKGSPAVPYLDRLLVSPASSGCLAERPAAEPPDRSGGS
jgi:hypothetical protein